MDQFMVRGTHSLMQWMLDLRTYGLKIHYNSTARGHVDWVGQDEIVSSTGIEHVVNRVVYCATGTEIYISAG
jgi:hypothetical protein